MSTSTERFSRRPALWLMPFQFVKASLISVEGGTVVIVLSQLRIFTVFRFISVTTPFALAFGTTIQSPTATMLFADSCMPETRL